MSRALRHVGGVCAVLTLLLQVQAPGDASKATLAVRVLDRSTERPLADVSVTVRTLNAAGASYVQKTSADGLATFTGLPPGEFEIQAESETHLTVESLDRFVTRPRPPVSAGTAYVFEPGLAVASLVAGLRTDATLRLPRAGIVSGVVTRHDRPLEGARVELLRVMDRKVLNHSVTSRWAEQETGPGGGFRFGALMPGKYLVAGSHAAVKGPTYYPSEADPHEAMVLEITAGWETPIHIDLRDAEGPAISGVVNDEVSGGRTELVGRRLDEATRDVISYHLVPLDADGRFKTPATPSMILGLRYTRTADDGTLLSAATAVVHVGTAPIPEIRLDAERPATLSGRFVFAGSEPRSDAAPTIYVTPAGPQPWMRDDLPSYRTSSDVGFRISGILGEQRVSVNTPEGWIAEAVLLADGRDILRGTFQPEPGRHYEGVRVVLTNRVASIQGTVAAHLIPGGPGSLMVVAVPEDDQGGDLQRPLWAHVDADGRFVVTNVRPGIRYVVAPCVWPCATEDSETVKALRRQGTPVLVDRPGSFTVHFPRR